MPDFPDLPGAAAPGIQFAAEDVPLPALEQSRVSDWIARVIDGYDHQMGTIQYIFCSDDYLHRINVTHLDHDTYTDIITFPYAEAPLVESDIYISTERVRENAGTFGVPFEQELHRVLIHGILHLCGVSDKGEAAAQMRAAEARALQLLADIP